MKIAEQMKPKINKKKKQPNHQGWAAARGQLNRREKQKQKRKKKKNKKKRKNRRKNGEINEKLQFICRQKRKMGRNCKQKCRCKKKKFQFFFLLQFSIFRRKTQTKKEKQQKKIEQTQENYKPIRHKLQQGVGTREVDNGVLQLRFG
jgi:hypothetical protein